MFFISSALLNNSDPTLRDLVISDNTGFNSGGGIHIELSNPNLADLTVSGNSAPDGAGGGVSIVDSSLVLDNVSISNNSAGYQGGRHALHGRMHWLQ